MDITYDEGSPLQNLVLIKDAVFVGVESSKDNTGVGSRKTCHGVLVFVVVETTGPVSIYNVPVFNAKIV